jgi:hypothetical protein
LINSVRSLRAVLKFFLSRSLDLPPARELKEIMCDCKEENLYLVVGCDSISQNTVWDSTNCNDRVVALFKFLNFMNLEILNQGNDSTFCSARKLEVIDITLRSFTLYSVHFGGLCTGTPDWESWWYQLELLLGETEGQVGVGPGNEYGR